MYDSPSLDTQIKQLSYIRLAIVTLWDLVVMARQVVKSYLTNIP